MVRGRKGFAATLGVAVMVASALLAAVGTVSAATPARVTLAGSKPTWAISSNLVRAADPKANVGFRVYLGWRDQAGAIALARAVSNPSSSSYGQYLSPTAFRNRFAPTATQAASIQNWLKSQGFSLVYTPSNKHYISAEGTVAQVQTAFATKINVYRVKGKLVRSPATNVSVPGALGSLVKGVIGLDDSAVFVRTYQVADKNAPPPAGFRNSPPCSTYWAQHVSPYAYPAGYTAVTSPATAPWAPCGYTPSQIKGAYGISGYDGAGQTVAIIDAYASPTILQDVNQWSINRGLPTMNPGQFTQVVAPGTFRRPQNPAQDPQGWSGEETLDVEAVHGMAPAAKIVYVGAPNNYRDLDAAMNHVVDRKLAQIVTNSYGYSTELLPRGFVKPLEDTFIQAAIEGIGVYFSSGDSGDNTSAVGFATPSWPASSPWVTAVGGTAIGIDAANSRALETGWGTSNYNCDTTTLACTRTGWLYGSGGGVSQIFAKPSYQSALNVTGRAIPDVAALGDPQTGLLIGQTQTFPDGTYYSEYRIGGTSLSSPIFAGLMALADQAAGHPHGFANPLFYAHSGAFYDVLSVKTAVARRNFVNSTDGPTVDRVRTFDDYSGSPTQHTNPGWDNVTGLGTPTSQFLPTFGQ